MNVSLLNPLFPRGIGTSPMRKFVQPHEGGARATRRSIVCLLLACILLAPRINSGASAAGADEPTARPSPFGYVDIFIDPHGKPLAAYQLELRAMAGEVKLVGIEGGEHKAYAHPPYYDPKALLNERVVLAAFNTGPAAELPSGKTRIARLMVRAGDAVQPVYEVTLQVAASSDAKPIDAGISVIQGVAQ
jgi:hypothetical protein